MISNFKVHINFIAKTKQKQILLKHLKSFTPHNEHTRK